MFKIGDKVLMTPERIAQFRGHAYYGVAPGQVYTINRILPQDYGQKYIHGFPWRIDTYDKESGGSAETDLILLEHAKHIDSWELKHNG